LASRLALGEHYNKTFLFFFFFFFLEAMHICFSFFFSTHMQQQRPRIEADTTTQIQKQKNTSEQKSKPVEERVHPPFRRVRRPARVEHREPDASAELDGPRWARRGAREALEQHAGLGTWQCTWKKIEHANTYST
jgi:hypothetical protein